MDLPSVHLSNRVELALPFSRVPFMHTIDFVRYFGTITTWYPQYHFTWAWLCHSLILISPLFLDLPGLEEPRNLRGPQINSRTRQSLCYSHRQRRWFNGWKLLRDKLKLELPAQPRPKISAAQAKSATAL